MKFDKVSWKLPNRISENLSSFGISTDSRWVWITLFFKKSVV
ncbi:MAG: hypothetical protein [Siphoviridae sp. cttb18]|nr:MAG: hypothetical protein [Siphoviridae sp. cttb18]